MSNKIITKVFCSSDIQYFEKQLEDFYNEFDDEYDIECYFKPSNNLYALLIARRKIV